jgi:hypothetical protein
MSLQELEINMFLARLGSRGIVYGWRSNPQRGHVFNAENWEGTVHFPDGQTGSPAMLGGYTGFLLMRTN